MPSTTPDLRTVTGGGSSLRGAGGWRTGVAVPGLASVNVDGVRPLRRGGSGGASGVLERSDFGQASSNVTGGASPDSSGGGAAGVAGGRSSTDGSGVRAWAR